MASTTEEIATTTILSTADEQEDAVDEMPFEEYFALTDEEKSTKYGLLDEEFWKDATENAERMKKRAARKAKKAAAVKFTVAEDGAPFVPIKFETLGEAVTQEMKVTTSTTVTTETKITAEDGTTTTSVEELKEEK